jgi:hypothetical protein
MIRRALLLAATAVALSAAGAMAFTPAFARAGRSWSRGILQNTFGFTRARQSVNGAHASNDALLQQDDAVQGSFCPVRPPVNEPTPLIPEASGAQMSTDPQASAAIDSSTLSEGEWLLPPSSALCRAGSVTPPSQSGAGH